MQLITDGPVSMITKGVSRAPIKTLFRKGEKEEELICQLCPKLKVIRKQGGSTSNHMRHLKTVHMNELKRELEKF